MTRSEEDEASASCNGADGLANGATKTLQPDRLAGGDFSNGVSVHAAAAPNVSRIDSSSKVVDENAASLPGSKVELQEVIKDSPFLDFSSPMTPYEWFKFVVMVSFLLLWLCMHKLYHLQTILTVALAGV